MHRCRFISGARRKLRHFGGEVECDPLLANPEDEPFGRSRQVFRYDLALLSGYGNYYRFVRHATHYADPEAGWQVANTKLLVAIGSMHRTSIWGIKPRRTATLDEL